MKTYIDVINETVEFYVADPVNRRSLSNDPDDEIHSNGCLYNGPDGKQCAFARCANRIDKKYEGLSAYKILDAEGINILKDEKQHLDNTYFWEELQNLHDNDFYWNESGLSTDGQEYVKELLEKYN
jgi:hypothetical protein